jgi:hypothetical protein
VDEQNLKELVEATGWDANDMVEELAKLAEDPSESVARYRELLEKYHREALRLYDEGDTRQAAEKMWASVLALIKLYASLKGIFVAHWSRGKIDSIIASSIEQKYRKLFRELIDKAQVLHEHFYEGNLNEELFKERWSELVSLFKEARKVTCGKLQK